MYSTWKSPQIKVNSTGVNCLDAKISLDSFTEPSYFTQDKAASFFNANNGIGGNLNLTFYLTGTCPIKAYITNEKDIISGYFGGLYFRSGYLKSYSLNCVPNYPVIGNAEIIFFDAMSGSFTKTFERSTGTKVLNYCDATLIDPSNDGAGGGVGKISGISNIQFQFNSDIEPLYLAGDQMPASIMFGKKDLVASFVVDAYSGDLPVTGKPGGIKVSFTHPEIAGLTESFAVSGLLFRREFETSVGNMVRARLYVKQAFADDIPGITTVSNLSAAPGDSITIDGTNMLNLLSVKFADKYASTLSSTSTRITVTVPDDVISGDIEVTTHGGIVRRGLFTPTFSAITVDKLQTISGAISGTAIISGSNFYRVTDVRFSANVPGQWTGSSGFQVINSSMISAPVPINAAWGPILVMATGRNVSGQSTERFVPIPTIYGFFPPSGLSGDSIIISGQGFSGVTGVLINNLLSIEPFTSAHTVVGNTGITVTIPTGNVRGLVKVLARSGISTTSTLSFSPFASITGTIPTSGRTGTLIYLLGHNLFPDIMHSLGNDSFAVTFGSGATGVFFRTQFVSPRFTGLSGLVPYNAKSGIVAINYDAVSTYPSNVLFRLINEPPTIFGVNPKSGSYSGYIDITGTNLYDISAVKISGMGVITTISNSIASPLGDTVSFRIPVNTPKITGEVYTVIVETTIGANVTGNSLLTILDAPIFSGFTGILFGTSGAFGDRILVSGKNIYPGSRIYIPFTGLSGESGQAIVDSGSYVSTNSQLAFYVPQSARTGLSNIILWNGIDFASGSNFKLINRPQFTGFAPASGEWGTGVSLFSGQFLSNVTGVSIGTGIPVTFSVITDTGITMTVPEDSDSDYVTVYSRAGSFTSTGKLAVYIPLPTLSGFTPTRAYSGDNLILSGSRLHTIDAILFTGGNSQVLFDYRYFTKVGSTGITMPVPAGISSGQITIRAPRGRVTSTSFFEPGFLPSISGISPTFGYHNKTISISGSNLSGMYVWFPSPNSGKFVSGLNTVSIGFTGLTTTIPREITTGPIVLSGSGRLWGSSNQTFYPLPTISGFGLATGLISGATLQISGINATQVRNLIFLTGSGNFFDIISGSFTIDLTNSSGVGIIDQRTGYTLLSASLSSITVDTGKLAIISAYFTGISGASSFLTSDIKDDFSNIISTNTFYLQETAPMLF